MNKVACQYAIVRFTPFIETGEFANAGIIMISPNEQFFEFKLLTRRHARITRFFEELDANVFKSTMYDLKEELERVNRLLKSRGFDHRLKFNDTDYANNLFNEIVRPRETIVRFSEPGVVLTNNPKKTLKELFAFYVERDFVTKEYREVLLEKRIRKWLFDANVGEKFIREKVGDEVYQATFPFVEFQHEQATKIIKPLNLRQETPSQILEHGGKWWFRIQELKRRHALPEKVLFAVEGPDFNDERGGAYGQVVDMLDSTGVTVFQCRQEKDIVNFALS